MSKILVTGAAGFIGSNLTRELLKQGHKVIGIDNFNNWLYSGSHKKINISSFQDHQMFILHKGDIRTEAAEIIWHEKPHTIVHLAAVAGVQKSVENASLYYDVNLMGTNAILDAIKRVKTVQNFVMASTSSVYSEPDLEFGSWETERLACPRTPYAASKLAAELAVANHNYLYGLPTTILRLFTAYGPHNRPDMMAFKLAENIRTKQHCVLYQNAIRDWTYVDDIVRGIILAINNPFNNHTVINLGSGQSTRLIDFLRLLSSVAGSYVDDYEITQIPKTDALTTKANIDKAKKLLGYTPSVTIEEGIPLFWKWYKTAYGE